MVPLTMEPSREVSSSVEPWTWLHNQVLRAFQTIKRNGANLILARRIFHKTGAKAENHMPRDPPNVDT